MAKANKFAQSLEARKGVIDCTIFHGFQFCDIPHVGVHIVCTCDNDQELAQRVAQEMGLWIWNHRKEFLLELLDAEQAMTLAAAVPKSEWEGKPVVVHETSDNPGGGATGDATYLLRAMLNAGFGPREAVFGFIVDSQAVAIAEAAGVGARLQTLVLGGKVSSHTFSCCFCPSSCLHVASTQHFSG